MSDDDRLLSRLNERCDKLQKDNDILRDRLTAVELTFGWVWEAFEEVKPGLKHDIMTNLLKSQKIALKTSSLEEIAKEFARLAPDP